MKRNSKVYLEVSYLFDLLIVTGLVLEFDQGKRSGAQRRALYRPLLLASVTARKLVRKLPLEGLYWTGHTGGYLCCGLIIIPLPADRQIKHNSYSTVIIKIHLVRDNERHDTYYVR